MRPIIAAILSACLLQPTLAAEVSDSLDARRAAATRYADTADLKTMLTDTVTELAKSLPAEQRDDFRQLMLEEVNVGYVRELMIAAMSKHFTLDELNALADFFGSDVGRSAMSKYGS